MLTRTGSRLAHAGVAISGLILALVVWDLVVRAGIVSGRLVPPPLDVLETLAGSQRGYFLSHAWDTLHESAGGFALSVLVGVPLGWVIATSGFLEKVLYPLLVTSQVVPKIAIGPLFLIWLGTGLWSKVVFVFLLGFFPVVIDSAAGFTAIEREKLYLARSMGSGPVATFVKIRFPRALPHIFAGMKVAILLCVSGAIVAEFIGSQSGLGWAIVAAGLQGDTEAMYAAAVCVGVMAILGFAFVDLAERRLVPWAGALTADRREKS